MAIWFGNWEDDCGNGGDVSEVPDYDGGYDDVDGSGDDPLILKEM